MPDIKYSDTKTKLVKKSVICCLLKQINKDQKCYKNRKSAKSLRRLSFLTQTLQNYTIELIVV